MIPSTKVWQFYQKIPPYQAQCNLCSKILQTGGGTTNVRNHLKSKHKEYIEGDKEYDKSSVGSEFTELIVESDDVIQEVIEVEPERVAYVATQLSGLKRTISPIKTKPVKRSRSENRDAERIHFENVSESNRPSDPHRDSRITNALAFMIYKDDRPTSIIEERGFRRFVETAAPSYKLLTKNEISEVIFAQHDAITLRIKSKLENVNHLSLSLLVYTLLNRSFLVISAHFIGSETDKFETIFLSVRPLPKTPTAEQCYIEIEYVLSKFNLAKTKIVSVCANGSANMTLAVKQQFGDEKYVQCLASELNSVVKDGCTDSWNPGLQQLITEVNAIVADAEHNKFFGESQTGQLVEKLARHDLNTTDRFVLSLPFVVEALSNFDHEHSTLDLPLLTEINKLLALFDVAAKEITTYKQPTGSVVLPMISCVKTALHSFNAQHDIAKALRKKLLLSLGTRTKTYSTQPLLCRATVCDPRFKKVYLPPHTADQAIAACCGEVKQHLRATRRSSRASEDRPSTSRDNTLWGRHDKTIAKGGFNSDVEMDTSIVSEDELKLYMGQELLPRNADPVKFWTQSRGCMPSLSHVALNNLIVLGSTVSEMAFVSNSKRLAASKGFLLTDHQLAERIFLNCVLTTDAR